jgi:HD-like signal output (HDOD) protein
VLPAGVPFLIRALNNDQLSFAEIARAIEHVPSVAARLLALANSAWSAPVRPIVSIEAACSRLGMRVVRTTSVALAISQPFNPARCPPFDWTVFWSSALLNAEASAWVARHARRSEMASARTAGLLSNLGLLWLAESLPSQTGSALEISREDRSRSLNQHLQAACGIGYDEAGRQLAVAWRLPPILCEAIADQFRDTAETAFLPSVVRGATRLVSSVRHQRDWAEPDPGLARLGLDMPTQLAGVRYLGAILEQTTELAEGLFGGD